MRRDDAHSRVRKALNSLLATNPFFGVLALRMPAMPGKVKTIAGDGVMVTYNPEWVAEASYDEIKGCLAHIVFACALKHHTRRGERDYAKWQRASRIATAELLEREELWVPDGVPAQDRPVERIYDDLDDPDDSGGGQGQPQAAPSAGQAQPQPAPGDGGAGEQGQQGQDPFAPDPQPPQGPQGPQGGQEPQGGPQPQTDPQQGQGQPQQGQDPFAPDPEDGQGQGDDQSQEPPLDPGDLPGEVQDAPQEYSEEVDRQWDRASKQAAAATKAMGRDPGAAEQMFEGQHDHRQDWLEQLSDYMRAVAPTDFSWAKPNRRLIDAGLYLPSMHGEGMGPLVIAIDTSGSVDDDHVNMNCANIFGIAQDVMPERIHVIQCDTKVRAAIDFDPLECPDRIKIKGRGGTRFQPVFDHIEREGIDPHLLIYMTDLEGPMPDEPDYPVLWAVETEAQEAAVPFGDSIVVPMEE